MPSLSLPAMIDLPAATVLAEALRAKAGAVQLEGAAVERIGVAGLQLLLSAQATAQAGGQAFTIEAPSDALIGAIRTAGADRLLTSAR